MGCGGGGGGGDEVERRMLEKGGVDRGKGVGSPFCQVGGRYLQTGQRAARNYMNGKCTETS